MLDPSGESVREDERRSGPATRRLQIRARPFTVGRQDTNARGVSVEGGVQSVLRAARVRPEAVVVDAGRSDDVLGACRTLRSAGLTAPLLALGTRDAVATRVAVLEAGADDYVVKPFVVDELLARVRALVRRGAAATGELVQVADLTLDAGAHEVIRGERRIDLTPIEFRLLELLMHNAGRVIHRSSIFEHVLYVGYLRRMLESAPGR
jgi:DNA-binding response OmpR family regulator